MLEQTETHNPARQPDTLNPDLMAALGQPDQAVVDALHPDSLSLKDSIKDTVSSLHRLPFLATGQIEKDLEYPEAYAARQIDNATFPMSRIVSVKNFQSWAGRGRGRDGEILENGGYSSASAVHHYAEQAPNVDYQPTIQLFKDRDGIVWGFMNTDGAHRTAGAKARGDKELKCTVYTDAYDHLPTFKASIAETLLTQDKQRKRFLGRLALHWQAKSLARDSALFDQKQASARDEVEAKIQDGDDWI